MKILIICSKRFYNMIPSIKKELEQNNIEVFLQIVMIHQTQKKKCGN